MEVGHSSYLLNSSVCGGATVGAPLAVVITKVWGRSERRPEREWPRMAEDKRGGVEGEMREG